MASGSWALAEELFTRGDAAFLAEVRRIHDADRLGNFAARWLADPRPAARRLLIVYLSLPLNAYRHEALVKRLFKGAEKAGDDELMGLFLVAFDRSVRRNRKTITRRKWDRASVRERAHEGNEGGRGRVSLSGMVGGDHMARSLLPSFRGPEYPFPPFPFVLSDSNVVVAAGRGDNGRCLLIPKHHPAAWTSHHGLEMRESPSAYAFGRSNGRGIRSSPSGAGMEPR